MDEPGDKRDKGSETPEQGPAQVPESSPDVREQQAPKEPESPTPEVPPHPYEELMDDYPLREPGDDPVWSIRVVKGWMWFLAFTTGGILLLIILGFFYD